MQWIKNNSKAIDQTWAKQAQEHQNTLTKPQGSLGRLEEIAIEFCAWQNTLMPKLDNIAIRIFASDHGIAAQGVSAFPQAVTAQMIANFVNDGAAISVLAKQINADLGVVNLGTVGEVNFESERLTHAIIAPQTADMSQTEAMSEAQLSQAFSTGKSQIDLLHQQGCALFIGGEMGIGNTTAASALFAALLNKTPAQCSGPGTGLDHSGLQHKTIIVQKVLDRHTALIKTNSTIDILRAMGGFEIAALCAAYLRGAQLGIPLLIDGFICSAAALLAVRIQPQARDWMLFSHRSAEPAHQAALKAMNATPLLDLSMRLGEGSGAAVAVSLLQSALNLHNGMASFAEAGVSTQ